jgi:hypothetical protein
MERTVLDGLEATLRTPILLRALCGSKLLTNPLRGKKPHECSRSKVWIPKLPSSVGTYHLHGAIAVLTFNVT